VIGEAMDQKRFEGTSKKKKKKEEEKKSCSKEWITVEKIID
jgi:hypothetical protein